MKERHFTKENDLYSLHQNIKQNVSFKQHDLLMQSFDTNYDLIICRNVMIYFTEEARVKLYEKFSRSLRKGGVLFVGSTEQILTPSVTIFSDLIHSSTKNIKEVVTMK